jgi:hypothetical protein
MMAIVFFDDVDEVDLHLPILRKSGRLKEKFNVLIKDVGFESKRIVGALKEDVDNQFEVQETRKGKFQMIDDHLIHDLHPADARCYHAASHGESQLNRR